MPRSAPTSAPISIRRWDEIAEPQKLASALDDIFFESSGTKSFASEEERSAFRERWLGRYLSQDPQWAYLAIGADGALAGYLVGSVDDPVRTPRFADTGYFQDFAHLTADYPAHLHVNLAQPYRNGGIGSALLERFAADATRAGVAGLHVVSGADARNVGFYARNGLRELARTRFGGNDIVFLGRRL